MSSLISHLGGVFIYSDNPEELGRWYKKAFNLEWEFAKEYNAWYISYPYKTVEGNESRYTVFSILLAKESSKVEGKAFTINLRVKNCQKVFEHLSSKDISCSEPKTYPGEGTFAWLQDPEGNYIELWEDVNTQ